MTHKEIREMLDRISSWPWFKELQEEDDYNAEYLLVHNDLKGNLESVICELSFCEREEKLNDADFIAKAPEIVDLLLKEKETCLRVISNYEKEAKVYTNQNDKLKQQNKMMREVLEFYANDDYGIERKTGNKAKVILKILDKSER